MDVIRRVPFTGWLVTLLGLVFVVDPELVGQSYFLLAPWAHAGFSEVSQNLAVLIVTGWWLEHRVAWRQFAAVSLVAAYVTLYAPVVFGFGGWAQGVSGLTNVYVGYVWLVLVIGYGHRVGDVDGWRNHGVMVGYFGLMMVVTAKILVTAVRFTNNIARRMRWRLERALGLTLGVVWFLAREAGVKAPNVERVKA